MPFRVSRSALPLLRRAATRVSVAVVILVLAVAVFAGVYLFTGIGRPPSNCDAQLSSLIGASASGICLQPLQIVVNSNATYSYVPVLVMNASSTATVDILYHLAAGAYVSHPNLKPTLYSTDVPLALSMASAKVNRSAVWFSSGAVVFRGNGWVIYRYTVNAVQEAAGYYAILPKYYWGMFPALAIGVDPNHLNVSALSTWGLVRCCSSGEIILPSSIVGSSGFEVVNATIPTITECPNAACNIISHSLY